MKKKNSTTAWDILDTMWNSFHDVDPKTKWRDFMNACSPVDVEEYIKEMALEKFLFETKYLFSKPDRSTIKWLWGEHAMLYDIFGCSEHRFVCKTSDNYENYVDGLTVFCPECNDNWMTEEKKKDYISLVSGRFCTKEEWKSYIKTSKWYKQFNRKQNFKYKLNRLFREGYLKYYVLNFFKSMKTKMFG